MDKFSRNRLINAIVYFARNTKSSGKIKIFKLLYLLDFEHFRQTGKSVTGFEYQAWKFGPVPVALMEEWEQPKPDMAEALHIEAVRVIDYCRYEVKVNDGVEFDDEDFTPRQLRIMEELCARFGGALSEKMIDVTHEQNEAWDRVWQKGQGAFHTIPYELSIREDDEHRDALLQIAAEQRMYEHALAGARSVSVH
ncbi:Panacea domain-containing protein [Bordetella genomosp. 4]|uniref:Antitoxin SocA-like Panacea domain-containing protein n=1 Tax=Bordetella genomosp. 4 TaxID=463044 RepID=A0A261URT1_9BORD|nr:Panacea domain-containing protein [Bordetella genomosp. 4]OZI64599.1 hypothetical protein CAL20_02785 [Bordetella genomosp. 4]